MPRAGKEFEELVARIEKILAPLGANVTSPDYIKDKVTGRKREVDASIRVGDGDGESTDLVTIECRDYKEGRQDDRWIEQLITKREKLGAKKTIAVSSTGFSDSATITARHYGIELRQMSKITDTEIAKQWLGGFGISVVFCEFRLERLEIIDQEGSLIAIDEFVPSVVAGFKANAERTGFLTINGVRGLVSAEDIFNAKVDPNVWLTHDGELPVTVVMNSHGNNVTVQTAKGIRSVSRLAAMYSVQRREVSSTIEAVGRYGSMTEPLMDQVQGAADLGDVIVETDLLGHFGKPFPGDIDPEE